MRNAKRFEQLAVGAKAEKKPNRKKSWQTKKKETKSRMGEQKLLINGTMKERKEQNETKLH